MWTVYGIAKTLIEQYGFETRVAVRSAYAAVRGYVPQVTDAQIAARLAAVKIPQALTLAEVERIVSFREEVEGAD